MKKKMIVIVAVLAMILCFAGCGKNYDDVKTALANNTWYFNGGDTALNSITFGEEEATISQVSFDGNGKHDNGSNSLPYTIDDANINIEVEGADPIVIPYTMDGDALKLGDGYLTLEEIDAGLQGYWTLHKSDTVMGQSLESEYNLYVNAGQLAAESASKAAGGGAGDFFYYGPDAGTYTLTFGSFDTNMFKGSNWNFTIIDGKPVILHFGDVCTPSNGFPGPNGYKF